MKYLLVILLFCSINGIAQTKPTKKDQLPSKQEMEEMMKEIQQSMSEMSDEDKRMFDSMGVKMPDLKNMQQMASFAAANAGNSTGDVKVPKKDIGRISALPNTALTAASLFSYQSDRKNGIRTVSGKTGYDFTTNSSWTNF